MNYLKQRFLIVFGVCFVAVVISASTATGKIKPEKRDTAKQLQQPLSTEEMADDIFADETKKKRSQEVIMFGNQQNKPAGMVDDGLVRFAEKKAQKRQDAGNAADVDADQEDQDVDDQETVGSREILPPGMQMTSSATADDKAIPPISEVGQVSEGQDDARNGQQSENSDLDSAEPSYLARGGFMPESQLDELEDSPSQSLEADPSYLPRDWSEYSTGNRFYGNDDDTFRRRRRNAASVADRMHHRRLIHKRSLLTPLDQLMNSRRGAGAGRWKRDLKLSKDDVVGLLGILAAAEAAKERQQSRQHGLSELESAYLDSLSETRPAESDDVDGLNRYLSALNRYDSPIDDEPDNDVDAREVVPDWGYMEGEPSLQLQRRSKPFYPPVDYRSLGVIGVKKRSTSHYYPGMWGRFESKQKRAGPSGGGLGSGIFQKGINSPNFRARIFRGYDDDDDQFVGRGSADLEHDVDDDGDVDDEGGRGTLRDEQLYTLGELLNGNDVVDDDVEEDDSTYPGVYKRLI